DLFWVRMQERRGQMVATAFAHNGAFVINALENLAGGEAFIGLRGRGVTERPFDRVEEIRKASEARFKAEEKQLEERFTVLKKSLAGVTLKGDGQLEIGDKEKAAIETFKSELVSVRKKLRDVQLAQRTDIDSLASRLKFWNIYAIPLLIGVAGMIAMAMRRRRQAGT
ncbi:MAG TPA: ABC transporter, partial [Hyphomicrobiaceae bacterium]|nr:ABC transporter [Hyphomicrobiaceae bacterium]